MAEILLYMLMRERECNIGICVVLLIHVLFNININHRYYSDVTVPTLKLTNTSVQLTHAVSFLVLVYNEKTGCLSYYASIQN